MFQNEAKQAAQRDEDWKAAAPGIWHAAKVAKVQDRRLLGAVLLVLLAGCSGSSDSRDETAAADSSPSASPSVVAATPTASPTESPEEEELTVVAPANSDPAATVLEVLRRLKEGGFDCDPVANDRKYGTGVAPRATAYSPAAASCTVVPPDEDYTVSAYTTEDTREEGEAFITMRGRAFVAGDFFIVDGESQAGVEAAAAALKTAK